MKKNFYHKIGVAELLAEVVKTPEAQRGEWVLSLALDLVEDNERKSKTSFAKELIRRTKHGRKHAQESGAKGGKKKAENIRKNNTLSSNPSDDLSNPIASSRSSSRTRSKKKEQTIIPEWIDAQTWQDFKTMRTKIKAPMTAEAEARLIAKLGRFRDNGQDVNEVLDQSIISGWKGVFPVKEDSITGVKKSEGMKKLEAIAGGSHVARNDNQNQFNETRPITQIRPQLRSPTYDNGTLD